MPRGPVWHTLILASGLSLLAVARAGDLDGRVIVADDGSDAAQAMVTLSLPAGTPGPAAITVFSDAQGAFHFSGLPAPLPAAAKLTVEKLGYRQADPADGALRVKHDATRGADTITLVLQLTDNIAAQVPASAWFDLMPPGRERNITLTSCTSCHQFPSPRVREYADQIEAVCDGPNAAQKAVAEWQKVIRHEAWRTIVKYMRPKHFAVFPLESPVNLDAVDWKTATNPDYNFFNARQGDLIAQYLAEHFPHSTAALRRSAYGYGAPLGVTAKTVIREYAFPDEALVRELVPAPGSPYLWGTDVNRNFLVRLDPNTGGTTWYRPDYQGSTGPHTIVPDEQGRVWISMIDNDQFGRFDPHGDHWTLWTLRPNGLPDTAAMAGSAIVHDIAVDSRGHLGRDRSGHVWVTLVGSNQMGMLDPDSGKVGFFDTNHVPGMSPINHLIYGAVMAADGRRVWYSQLNGDVGAMNTETHRLEKLVPFENGVGPRRMSRDDDGHLWVALFGVGQVAEIDMASGKLLRKYDLPDRASAPYAVSWDARRKALWVANANSDVIYRLDPATGQSRVYPLPRRMAYLRQIGIDENSGDLVASYGNYPAGSGPSMGLLIQVGD